MSRKQQEEERQSALPPHDLKAEKAFLASLLLLGPDGAAIFAESIRLVDRTDLFSLDHQEIYEVILSLHQRKKNIDAIILRAALEARGKLAEIGGLPYIAEIISSVPATTHAVHYAQIVRDMSDRRAAIHVANRMISRAQDPSPMNGDDDSARAILQDAAEHITRLMVRGESTRDRSIGDAVNDAVREIDSPAGFITTGIDELDQGTGGIREGEIVFLAARPSMGKSMLAKQIARHVAATHGTVGYLSLEESAAKLAQNALASSAMVSNRAIRTGRLTIDEKKALAGAVTELAKLPIRIARCPRLPDLRAIVARWKAKYDLKMLIVDHLGLIQTPGVSMYERATLACSEVVSIIRQEQVTGLVLAQLNRELTKREDKRPTLSDLRDSGRIEEDADGVLLLHREDYFRTQDPGYIPTRIAEVIIAKWRDSERGATVRLRCDLSHQRFEPETPTVPPGMFDR